MQTHDYFLTCPKGIEDLLAKEVAQLGGVEVKQTVAGVSCQGEIELGYRLCLWSRLANKVLLPVHVVEAETAEQMYANLLLLAWDEHLDANMTFAIDFSGSSKAINNTHFGALKVKDALVDYFVKHYGKRPDVDSQQPDVRINARLRRGRLTVSIDLSGDSLHKRGYRQQGAAAPLKENLAVALLLRANWPEIAQRGGALLDPMCGSGTLLVEAGLMAADIAPGLARKQFGFSHWLGHVPAVWQRVYDEALERKQTGLAKALPEIRGYDRDSRAYMACRDNIERAGIDKFVRASVKELSDFKPPTHTEIVPGLVICNPPYGARLGEGHALVHLYQLLSERLKSDFGGWQAAIFSGDTMLLQALKLRAEKKYKLFNGAIACELHLFSLYAKTAEQLAELKQLQEQQAPKKKLGLAGERAEKPLSEGAQMLLNRLAKNQKNLAKWLKREGISCYRLYDADLPEYNVAIDHYEGRWQVTEYAPPKNIDPVKAAERFGDVQAAMQKFSQQKLGEIVFKERSRQRGRKQYEKRDQQQEFFQVTEGQCQLEVNLKDYLDTGLFLDHRPMRLRIAQEAKGKKFLNLFCYTAVASLHALKGGAAATTSVDMSGTYTQWARRNLDLNQADPELHQVIQADCLTWLEKSAVAAVFAKGPKYDLIFLDPPSFSNSKRMQDSFDIQRDHENLIDQAMALLEPGGCLYFSNNLRSFKLAAKLEQRYKVENISAKTIDMDFKRNPKIHYCWKIQPSD